MKTILHIIFTNFILAVLLTVPVAHLQGQNLIVNGSMTSVKGENVIAPGWSRSTPNNFNTPDVNDANGLLNTTIGYTWAGGVPVPSPDGGTWQNVFSGEGLTQTITGLTIGQTYYFRYYYCSQGIKGYGFNYIFPSPPYVSITGATGYTNPQFEGALFTWNTYCTTIIATATSITIKDSASRPGVDYYMAYDGFYLSATAFPVPQITQQPADVELCSSGDADFSVQTTNALTSKWQVNTGTGWTDIVDNTTYSGSLTNNLHITNATALMNNYKYRCGITNNACAQYSIPATLVIKTPSSPSLIILATALKVCQGKPVTFTAIPQYGGTAPAFQWKKNNIPVGTNNIIYTENSPANGDVFSCTLTSNESCVSSTQAISNNITINLFPDPTVLLDKSSGICTNSSRILDAGNFASYLWNNGSNGQTLSINTTGIYYVKVTDNNGCTGSDTSKVTTVLPSPRNFLPHDTAICTTYGSILIVPKPGYKNFIWNNNSTGPSLNITKAGLYWLNATDSNKCSGTDSIKVLPKQCLTGMYIPNAFTPNVDGRNDLFKPLIFGNLAAYEFFIYNRYGEIIFKTKDISQGWNGKYLGKSLENGTFVWTCKYQLSGEEVKLKKGAVLLIR